jgi:hypothetical protein
VESRIFESELEESFADVEVDAIVSPLCVVFVVPELLVTVTLSLMAAVGVFVPIFSWDFESGNSTGSASFLVLGGLGLLATGGISGRGKEPWSSLVIRSSMSVDAVLLEGVSKAVVAGTGALTGIWSDEGVAIGVDIGMVAVSRGIAFTLILLSPLSSIGRFNGNSMTLPPLHPPST